MTTASISRSAFEDAVSAAIRAPSFHNSQPWHFRLHNDRVEVRADMSRLLRVADPDGWGLRLSCGAATYNLRLAFAVQGAPLDVEWQPRPGDPELLAVLRPATPKPPTPLERRLYAAIPRRHSNRRPFRDEPVPLPARVALIDAARETSAWLELVSGTVPVAAMAEIAQAANRVLRRDAAYIAELASWTRRGEASDGVPAVAGGPSPEPQDLLPLRPFSDLVRLPGKDFEPEPLIAVLGTLGDRPVDRLMAGQALQRVLLTVTDLGLASSMFSQPIEVPSAREQLRIALGRYGAPQMVLRIGFGDPGSPTPRRPAAEVIDEHLAGPEPETGPMAGVESR